jgi:myo-inositol-1-phosphate synthase
MGLKKGVEVKPASGKLGVLLPGMGAVATTFVAGVLAVRRGLAKPIGSLTQMGTIRLGKRTDNRVPTLKEYVPLASIDDLCFGGWDIFPEDMYQAALKAGVLEKELLAQLKSELEAVRPMPAVFEQNWVKKLHGTHVKKGANKMELADQLIADIQKFQKDNGCDRLVMVWCGSTEIYRTPTDVHSTLAKFEEGLKPPRRSTPTRRSSSASRSATARPTSRSTSRPRRSWPRRTRCRSPARTSRPARP